MLSDPNLRTFCSGHALDRVLFDRGDAIPPGLIMEGLGDLGGEVGAQEEAQFYPAVTFPREVRGDHHPLLLSIQKLELPQLPAGRIYKFDRLAMEQWGR